jgi:hypothetical protein
MSQPCQAYQDHALIPEIHRWRFLSLQLLVSVSGHPAISCHSVYILPVSLVCVGYCLLVASPRRARRNTDIIDTEWSPLPFNYLTIPDKDKEIIIALAESCTGQFPENIFDDFVTGKGRRCSSEGGIAWSFIGTRRRSPRRFKVPQQWPRQRGP